MSRRLKIIILVVLLVAAGIVVFVTTSSKSRYDPTENITNSASQPHVTITNADDYGTWFDTNHIPAVESAIYKRIKDSIDLPASNYNAVIRQDSLQTTYHPYEGGGSTTQVPTVAFLVDIPSASETYKVTFSGGEGYPYSILYVLCPSSNQLKYGDFGCKDTGQ
jgi:hypothetical protein